MYYLIAIALGQQVPLSYFLVVTPIVCVEHGLGGAETGINVARGDKITSADRAKTEYPCPRCAVPSPRWDRRSCPKCGGSRLDWLGQILWD
jgi:hypothetical protein